MLEVITGIMSGVIIIIMIMTVEIYKILDQDVDRFTWMILLAAINHLIEKTDIKNVETVLKEKKEK